MWEVDFFRALICFAMRPLSTLAISRAQPPLLGIRHRLFTARRVTAVCRALWDTRRDRPKPWPTFGALQVQHTSTDDLVTI
jgi:hypothetical protein